MLFSRHHSTFSNSYGWSWFEAMINGDAYKNVEEKQSEECIHRITGTLELSSARGLAYHFYPPEVCLQAFQESQQGQSSGELMLWTECSMILCKLTVLRYLMS
ncbi:hypothetical protein PS2_021426 [Malus domestica]